MIPPAPARLKTLQTAALRHLAANRLPAALRVGEQILCLDSTSSFAHHVLGLVAQREGRTQEAVAFLRKASAALPDDAECQCNFGVSLAAAGRDSEALRAFHRAIALRPDYFDAHKNISVTHAKAGRLLEAADAYRKAISLNPNDAETMMDLNAVLMELGRISDAIDVLRQIAELHPTDPLAGSDLLFMLHYHPIIGDDRAALYSEHVAWARKHFSTHAARGRLSFDNVADADKQLRVGFVSADFRDHPVARFVLPLLRSADRTKMYIIGYSDVGAPDVVTERCSAAVDAWRDSTSLTDSQLHEQVAGDQIDVLIDLTSHMHMRRLAVFAGQAAPVQVTGIGYPDTTGLPTFAARLTDGWHDPQGASEQFHSEPLLRIPGCCWCYDPCNGAVEPTPECPPLAPLPYDVQRHITFGCFNRLLKVTSEMLRVWASILRRVPGSVLHVLSDDSGARSAPAWFEEHGIPKSRVVFFSRRPRTQYLELISQVDIQLDTFPYNGHTTTLDAIWMGVPVVSRMGQTHVARAGYSVMSALGLSHELVCETSAAYEEIAVNLAFDVRKLREYRAGLRERMRGSSIMGAERYAAEFHSAMRKLWRDWCAAKLMTNDASQ